jgi:hypothetical protein
MWNDLRRLQEEGLAMSRFKVLFYRKGDAALQERIEEASSAQEAVDRTRSRIVNEGCTVSAVLQFRTDWEQWEAVRRNLGLVEALARSGSRGGNQSYHRMILTQPVLN